jgi:predicted S18 family serine protease
MLYTYPFLINCVTETGELERELTAAREEIEMLGIRYAAAEMHHTNNMQEVTEQRDRLAEAMKAADECLEMASFSKNGYTRRVIDEALQSLTNPNAK